VKVDPVNLNPEVAVSARVQLKSDAYAGDGATRDMIGYVIERYPDGNLEVEFSNPKTGETIAQIVVPPWEIIAKPLTEQAAAQPSAASRFYAVNDRPVVIVRLPNGGEDCLVYDFASGELLPDRSYFEQVVPGSGKDVDSLSEAEFAERVDALHDRSAKTAIEQLRTWITALGGSTGDVTATAAALGWTGRIERGDLVVELPGYVKASVEDLRGDVGLELYPRGSLFSRELCDDAFGAGRDMPIVDTKTSARITYEPIAGSAKPVTISIDFSQPRSDNGGGARRIFIRRGR
jgi:hypothetical protein